MGCNLAAKTISKVLTGFHPACCFVWLLVGGYCNGVYLAANTISEVLSGFHPACCFVGLQVLFLCCVVYIKVRHYLDAILLGQICRTQILRHEKGGWKMFSWNNIDLPCTGLLKDPRQPAKWCFHFFLRPLELGIRWFGVSRHLNINSKYLDLVGPQSIGK